MKKPWLGFFGQRATGGIRTHDLTITNRLLCQLSYGGKFLAGEIIKDLTLSRKFSGFHVVW